MTRRDTILFIAWAVCIAALVLALAGNALAGGINLFLEYVHLMGRL